MYVLNFWPFGMAFRSPMILVRQRIELVLCVATWMIFNIQLLNVAHIDSFSHSVSITPQNISYLLAF